MNTNRQQQNEKWKKKKYKFKIMCKNNIILRNLLSLEVIMFSIYILNWLIAVIISRHSRYQI